MNDQDKTREQLIEELARLRGMVAELRQENAECRSDRQRLESALQESDRRFKALLYNLPEKVFHKDRESVYVSCNRNYAADCGLEPEQMVGKTDYEFFPPDIAAKYRADDSRIMASGGTEEIEESYYTRTGEERLIRTVKAVLRDEQGQITGILGIFSDITERKRAEAALQKARDELELRVEERTAELTEANRQLQREAEERKHAEETIRQSEAKYRALVESSPDAVAMCDLEGRITFASERVAQRHGVLHPDELIGSPAMNLVVEGDRERFWANTRRLIEEGLRRNDQYRGLRTDGTTFAAEISSAVIRDASGNPEALMGVYRDITERKLAEEKLAILARFVESATEGFGMCDLDRRITYVNPMMVRLLGEEKPEDVLGKNLLTYHPSGYAKKGDEVIRPAVIRDGYWQGELPLLCRNGTIIPTLHNVFPVRDNDGNVHHFAVVVTDITELRQSEAKYRALDRVLPGCCGHAGSTGSGCLRLATDRRTARCSSSRRIGWAHGNGFRGAGGPRQIPGESPSLDRRRSPQKRRVHVASQRRNQVRCRSFIGGHPGR